MKKKIYNQPVVEATQVKSTSIILAGSLLPGPPVTPDEPIQDGD